MIAFSAFWVLAIWIWFDYGAKIPLIFICLWIVGFAAFSFFELNSYLFMTFQAALAAILLVIKKYNDVF